MQTTDIVLVLQWWSVFLLISGATFPLTSFLFRPFFDKGYIFSKTLGLILIAYAALVLGIAHILPFTQFNLTLLVVLLGITNYGFLTYHHRKTPLIPQVIRFFKRYGVIIIFQELVFLGGIFFLAYIRSFSPEIHGLEKYMDFGFMNSILRTDYFPPNDMWLTPFSVNYYYFGHITGAVLTKLSMIPPNLTYNLILASVFSLSFVGSFSLGANLFSTLSGSGRLHQIKRLLAGLLTAGLVTLSGNLHTLYAFFKPYENESPRPLWSLEFLPASFPNAYWYPNATRFIYNTIHEFPMYSWVVADLHGHVFDIPFVITFMALIFSLLLKSQTRTAHHEERKIHQHPLTLVRLYRNHPVNLGYLVLLGLLLSVMYMTNAWDGLIYYLLAGLFLVYTHLTSLPKHKKIGFSTLFSTQFLVPLLFSGLFLFFCFYFIFSTPFNMHFKPFVSGIGVLCSPEFLVQKGSLKPFLFEAEHCQRSPWWQLLMLYGFFYFFIFAFMGFLTRVRQVKLADTYILLLIILGTILIIIPEFVYVKDIYPAHYRANTMFKLVFQSFIILSIASSYSIVRILSSLRSRKLSLIEKVFGGGFATITLLLVTVVFIYPFQAVNSYYGELKAYKGLDGTAYLDTLYPADYQGILWLNKQVTGQPVILEAQGDSYTDFARVSANTGLPTVLGWTVHEWLWRNAYDIPNPPANPNIVYEVPAPRIAEVQTLYETENLTETKRLLRKYNVQYVFVGILERQKYPMLYEDKWNELGTKVFQAGTTAIYKIN